MKNVVEKVYKLYWFRNKFNVDVVRINGLLFLKLLDDFADGLQKVNHMQSYLRVTKDIEELNYEY